jgi:hypothetical protein
MRSSLGEQCFGLFDAVGTADAIGEETYGTRGVISFLERRRRRMNPIMVNAVALREDRSQYLIRYGLRSTALRNFSSGRLNTVFAQVFFWTVEW